VAQPDLRIEVHVIGDLSALAISSRSCRRARTFSRRSIASSASHNHHMRSPPDIASLTPGRGVMPAHGWIFSCLSSIPMNCSIRRARVSAFFAV
jgi:hypothetical protein